MPGHVNVVACQVEPRKATSWPPASAGARSFRAAGMAGMKNRKIMIARAGKRLVVGIGVHDRAPRGEHSSRISIAKTPPSTKAARVDQKYSRPMRLWPA